MGRRLAATISLLRQYRRDIGVLLGLLFFGGTLFVLALGTYIVVLCDSNMAWENVVDGSNYAMQTITTVGYGNWETPYLTAANLKAAGSKAAGLQAAHDRVILEMRGWSFWFMLSGGFWFGVLVSWVFSLMQKAIFRPPTDPRNVI